MKIQDFLSSQIPKIIRPAGGGIPYPYLIPGGFYTQQWDWDAFFMATHLANRSQPQPQYLRYWTDNFLSIFKEDEETPACVREDSKIIRHASLILKPFMAQGACRALTLMRDLDWGKKIFPKIKATVEKWEKRRQDQETQLFFWYDAMMSGADNNPAIGNEEKDRNNVLSCDVNAFLYGEYQALAKMATLTGNENPFTKKAENLKSNLQKFLWDENDQSLWNFRRDTKTPVKINSYSNFLPLTYGLLPQEKGRAMILKYLLKEETFLSPFGLRSLAKNEALYNNTCIIIPYSNWQGPVWVIANFLLFQALKKYGFNKEAKDITLRLEKTLQADLDRVGSLHENYDAETGLGLAPSAEQNNGKEGGFVSWNLLLIDMLEDQDFPIF